MAPSLPRPLDSADDRAALLARLGAGRLLVGLDFDGTLAPIVDRPEGAGIDDAMRSRLATLAALVPTAVVSGRDLDDLGRRVAAPGAILVGSHGIEIAYPGDGVERAPGLERSDAALGALIRDLRAATADLSGVLVEPKRHSVAVHWRLAGPADEAAAERIVEEASGSFPAFRIGRGKKVAEFRPAIERDKGSAIGLLRDHAAAAGSVPAVLYIGDDVTDEDAFRALDPENDIGILVADPPRPSAAGWVLPDTGAVAAFLDRLIEVRCRLSP
jgi:trehalose 6-phosphate phosphatase